MKLLITGGAGFIGSHLADRRLARGRPGRRARRLQRLLRPAPSSARNVAAHLANPRYRLVEGDIRDRGARLPPLRRGALRRASSTSRRGPACGRRSTQPVLYEEVNCVATLAPARGGRRARQAALRLRLVLVGLRHQREAALLRGGPDRPADLAVRHDQARRRAPRLHRAPPPRPAGRLPAVLHRLRPAAAPGDGDRALHPLPRGGRADPLLRRRRARGATTRTSTTSSTASRRRSIAGLGFEIVNLGGAHPVTLAELVAGARGRDRQAGPARPRSPISRGTCPSPSPSSRRPNACSGSGRAVAAGGGAAATVAWYREPAVGSAGEPNEAHEHLHGRHRIRGPRHGRVPRGLRHERRLRRQGRGEDRRAPARARSRSTSPASRRSSRATSAPAACASRRT